MALYNSPNYTVAQPKKTRQGKSQNTNESLVRQHVMVVRRDTEDRVNKKERDLRAKTPK